MPCCEICLLNEKCRSTIRQVRDSCDGRQSLGKAGCNPWSGRRPRIARVVMNPLDHSMARREGRTSDGSHLVSP
jgi:ribosomal protein L2